MGKDMSAGMEGLRATVKISAPSRPASVSMQYFDIPVFTISGEPSPKLHMLI